MKSRFTALFGVAISAIAGTLLATRPLLAQTVELDTLLITAARADRPVSDTPSTVHVIEREEIVRQLEVSSSPSAALAKLIPGYSVSNQTISGASEMFRGRGVLVMLDGVALNTPLRDVSRIINLIDLNAVERIEVVAGASSLYGSGATGGTVNFITRKAEDGPPRMTVNSAMRAFTANVGESLQPEISASLTGKTPNGFDYVFVGSGQFANKTYDGAGRELPSDQLLGQGGADRYGRGNFLGKVGYDFDAAKRFEISGTWIYLNQKPDYLTLYGPPFSRPDYTSPYTGQDVREDTKTVSARYTDSNFVLGDLKVLAFYNDVSKAFNYSEFDINFNGSVYYSGDLGAPTAAFNQTTLNSKRGGVNVTIDTPLDAIWKGAKVTWGADVTREDTSQILSNGQDVFSPLSQTAYAGFAQLQLPFGDRFTVRGGMRYEYLDLTVDDFVRPAALLGFPGLGYALLPDLPVTGGKFNYSAPTYNIGATFKLNDKSELYGGFSQGFALPDVGAFTRRAGTNGGAAEMLFYGCYLGMVLPPSPFPYTCPKSLAYDYSQLGIEPQIVNNYETGIRGSTGKFRGDLAGFISTSDKGVNFDPGTNSISQQKEMIWGIEATGELDITANLTLGAVFAYREGKYDDDGDGELDSYLPNNRIATPYRGVLYGTYRFDDGVVLRIEGEAFSGRNRVTSVTGNRYEIEPGAIMNIAISAPWAGGTVYLGVHNVFDTAYQNPTATSVRELPPSTTNPVYAFGRVVTAGFRKQF